MSDLDSRVDSPPPLLGRLLFASGLAVLALRNLANLEGRIAYADAKGVPFADVLVPASSGLLLGGSLGIGTWTFPKLSAGSVATFLLGVTPVMHDFWAVDEDARDEELTSFLQNLTLLGAAVVFFRRAQRQRASATDGRPATRESTEPPVGATDGGDPADRDTASSGT